MPDNLRGFGRTLQDAVAPRTDVLREGRSRLMDDLRAVIQDAEHLLRTAGDASRDGIGAARSQLEATLAGARERLLDAEDAARAQLNRAAYATNDYVNENPLRSLLIAGAVGATVAWLLTRGGSSYDDADEL